MIDDLEAILWKLLDGRHMMLQIWLDLQKKKINLVIWKKKKKNSPYAQEFDEKYLFQTPPTPKTHRSTHAASFPDLEIPVAVAVVVVGGSLLLFHVNNVWSPSFL